MRKKSVSQLKKEVWKIFSKYIRNRDNYTCFTCGTKKEGEKRFHMHAGHFVPRSHSATFLNEKNVHAQCYACNIIKKGDAGEYAYRLIQKYGNEEFEKLVKLGRTTKQFTIPELEELIDLYKKKINDQEFAEEDAKEAKKIWDSL